MEMKKIELFYKWAIRVLILAIPLLTLYVSRPTYFPYITGRNFIFRILVELALVLWVGLAVLNKEFRPKMRGMQIAVLVLLAVTLLADIFGVNPKLSFWSRFERMDGFLNLIHLAAYFFILASVFKKEEWFWFFNIFTGVALTESIYSFWQKLGRLPSIQGGFRVEGTIGNPAYLAALLVLAIFFVFLLFIWREKEKFYEYGPAVGAALGIFMLQLEKIIHRSSMSAAVISSVNEITLVLFIFGLTFAFLKDFYRYIYLFLAAIFVWVVYLSATRGAVLALIGAAIIFSIGYLFFSGKERKDERIKRRIALLVLVLTAAVCASVFLLKDASFIKGNETLNRLTSISLSDRTTQARFVVWEMAWRGVIEKPVLGWGQENFINVFNKYYDPRLYNQEQWFDRAHNVIMDWLVTTGFLGLFSCLALFVLALSLIYKKLLKSEKEKDRNEGLILGTALLAYFGQNLFVFDNYATYIGFFALLAYVYFRCFRSEVGIGKNESIHRGSETKDVFSVLIVVFGLAVFGWVLWVVNIKPLIQARKIVASLELMQERRAVDAAVLTSFREAINVGTAYDGEVREQMGKVVLEVLDTTNGRKIPKADRENFVRATVEEMEKEIAANPNNVRDRLFLATIYDNFSEIDSSFLDKALNQLKEAVKLSPRKHQIYFALAENAMKRKDLNKAFLILEQAYELEPNFSDARANLAYVAAILGKDEKVKEMLNNKVKNVGFFKVGDVYVTNRNFKGAEFVYEKAIEVYPGGAENYGRLAGVYAALGKFSEAEKMAKKAVKIDPVSYKDKVNEFLRNLEKMK